MVTLLRSINVLRLVGLENSLKRITKIFIVDLPHDLCQWTNLWHAGTRLIHGECHALASIFYFWYCIVEARHVINVLLAQFSPHAAWSDWLTRESQISGTSNCTNELCWSC